MFGRKGSFSFPLPPTKRKMKAIQTPTKQRLREFLLGIALIVFSGSFTFAIERVSVAADGTEADYYSERPGMSPNGRYVVFKSRATNLIPGGTSGESLIFWKDRMTGQVRLASTNAHGEEAEDGCGNPTVSADGRFVCFNTGSDNMHPEDDNSYGDVFVKDLKTGRVEWISQAPDGSENDDGSANAFITPSGRHVVFQSGSENLDPDGDANGGDRDIFVKDRKTGALMRVSEKADGTQANNDCYNPAITPDGRFVSFKSYSNNLVSDDTNNRSDIFVKDRKTGEVERISTSDNDEEEGDGYCGCHHLSDDGRYVIFRSSSSNLVPGDNNGYYDVFVKDRRTGATERVSVAADGSEANSQSGGVWISGTGRFACFWSGATNLLGQIADKKRYDYQIFVKDRKTGAIARVSESAEGDPGNDRSQAPFFTGGSYIAFKSEASNLVPDDTNGTPYPYYGEDIFVAKNPFADYDADTKIGPSRQRQKGNNFYTRTSPRQHLQLRKKAGKPHRFYFTVENDGNVFDDLRVRAASGGSKYRVTYREMGGGNITRQLTGGGAAIGLVPNGKVLVQAVARPKGKRRIATALRIQSQSIAKPSRIDVAKAKVLNDAEKVPISIKPTGLW